MRRNVLLSSTLLTLLLIFTFSISQSGLAHGGPTERTGLQSWDLDPKIGASFSTQQLAGAGTAGFTCSRIPALTTANNGWVIALWDGRPDNCADAPQPNSIIYTMSKDHGKTWGEVKVLAKGNPSPNQRGFSDPSLVVDRQTGRIFAFFVMSYDWAWPHRDRDVTSDRQVMHAVYFSSDDNGESWTGPADVTDALNPLDAVGQPNKVWTGRFAASGEGIQLRYGPNAGRLIQQYTVYNTITNDNWAVSLYSDDHGATWRSGAPVGPGMDENKVVELSDGRVMLNGRRSDSTGGRYVAYSSDGGATWSPAKVDSRLTDPRNNASIIRAFPNAPQGSAEAKVLLFSNAAAGSRTNGTIRVSYNDGDSWSDSKVFEPGSMSYSTMTTLADGTIGMLYEGAHPTIYFAKLSWAWLGTKSVSLDVAPSTLHRGANQVEVAISRNVGAALSAGTLSITGPAGFSGAVVSVPTLSAGDRAQVSVPVTVADTADPGQIQLTARYAAGDISAESMIQLPLALRDGETPARPLLRVDIAARDLPRGSYRAGDRIRYSVRVENLSGSVVNAVPRKGAWTNLFPTCRWAKLAAGGSYTCGADTGPASATPPTYTVTQADIDRGWVAPEMLWAVSQGGDTAAMNPLQEITVRAQRIELPS